MRHVAPVAAALALVLLPAPAPADADDDDAFDDVDEPAARPLKIKATLAGAIARLRVTAAIAHDGSGERSANLVLPVRGLVTAGTAKVGGKKHALALAPAREVSDRMDALFDAPVGGAAARAIAVEHADHASGVTVTTLLPRRGTAVVELEVEAATCFVGDRRHVRVPGTWADLFEGRGADVVDDRDPDGDGITPASAIDAACGDDGHWNGDDEVWLALPTTELSAQPVGDKRIGTVAGRFVHAATSAARVELALSRTISDVPGDLATVFVVDGSRSLYDEVVAAQGAVIASYLRHAPTTEVQVVAFDRTARALLAGWTTARAAAKPIAAALAGLVLRNGSDLDAGLAEAGRLLADHHGTRRIVVFTDELYPHRLAVLDPASLARTLPAGTVVHVVAIDAGDGAFARDDNIAFAPLADATGGMPVTAEAGTDIAIDALALVRPISLDHVRVIAPGFSALASGAVAGTPCVAADEPTNAIALGEGQACTWWALGPATADKVTVEGRLWGKTWRREVALGDRASVDVAREVWAVVDRDAHRELVEAADKAARAVNREWSMIATWGGTGGYGVDELIGSSSFGCGCDGSPTPGGWGTIGTGTYGTTRPSVEDQVRTAIAACHAGADDDKAAIAVELETTLHEIVGVDVAITGITGTRATEMTGCVTDAVWDLALWVDRADEHRRFSLRY